MYLHGGHVTSWTAAGKQDVLFVSANSLWADGHAIRGGVPICFPWFGDKADDPHAPAHGFVRTKSWQLESIEQAGDAVTVSMSTASEESTKTWWPADFRLLHRATFGPELVLELVVNNTGSAALRFEEAMHAYHRVGDVAQATVSGLNGVAYLDKTDSFRKKTQSGGVVIESETDRVYLDTQHPLTLSDPVLHRQIQVTKQNSRHHGGVESVGAGSPQVGGPGGRPVEADALYRDQQCRRFCGGVGAGAGTQHDGDGQG